MNLINRTLRITSIACHARGHVRRRELPHLVDLVRVGVSTDPHEHLGVRIEEHDVVPAQVVLAKVENLFARRADAADGGVAYLKQPRLLRRLVPLRELRVRLFTACTQNTTSSFQLSIRK